MRILHTSDWHLGRSLHGVDLMRYQREILGEIAQIAAQEHVDAVIVAGDVYDRTIPPVQAVQIFTEVLQQLAEQCTVIVTSGNHDSAVRLGQGACLYRDGVHVVTNSQSVGERIELRDSAGHVAHVYPIPYLDPDTVRYQFSDTDEPLARSHEAVTMAAMDRIRAIAADSPGIPYIVAAHLFAVGGQPSDSERDISVGGVDSVAAGVFDGADYVALGHLHGPQQISGPAGTTVRYSGSPMRFSLSEAGHTKSVTIVEIEEANVSTRLITLAQPRELTSLTGFFDDLCALAPIHGDDWVELIVTDPARPEELIARLKQHFPHALSITHRPPTKAIDLRQPITTGQTDPMTVIEQFVVDVTDTPATSDEVIVLRDAVENAQQQDRSN